MTFADIKCTRQVIFKELNFKGKVSTYNGKCHAFPAYKTK